MANGRKKKFGNRGGGRKFLPENCTHCGCPLNMYKRKRNTKPQRGHCPCCTGERQAIEHIRMDLLMKGVPHVVDFSNAPIGALIGWKKSNLEIRVSSLCGGRKKYKRMRRAA